MANDGARPAGGGLCLWLLGDFRVVLNGRPVATGSWRLRKAQSLLKLLALAPRHLLHSEQLLELLWPDLEPQAASNNLHQALHVARRALDSAPAPHAGSQYLRLERGIVALRPPDGLWVDLEAFRAAVSVARRRRDLPSYEAALACYSGDLLPDDRYEDWATAPRQELRATYHRLFLELAELQEEQGEYAGAITTLQRAIECEPAAEEAHRALVRLYTQLGQPERAMRQEAQLREVLRQELAAEPSGASRHLSTTRLADQRAGSERPVATAPPSHNLPCPLTSFVGREQELAEIERLLGETRLLTLTGVGGCGKSRLALAAASALTSAYRDGVCLVSLAPLSAPELLPQALATALGLQEAPGRVLTQTLTAYLRRRALLLVLDNCEHLASACARLSELLLSNCGALRILATSRVALRVAGEVTLRVPPLHLPPAGSLALPALARCEAVALFLERARDRQSAFALSPGNAPAIVAICRRLDGLPLALELAAALVPALTVEELAARLGQAMPLLTVGSRTLPRQATLRATLDWSHALLDEEERTLFRRLAVFAGTFELEAAETVCCGDGVLPAAVAALLARLVDQSLVETAAERRSTRYRLLEPVRQYAWERLATSGEAPEAQRRHAQYFFALAESADRRLSGRSGRPWLERLRREHHNVRAAQRWALAAATRGDVAASELSLRLAGALVWFWMRAGHLSEGFKWVEAALAQGEAAPPAAHAQALHASGELAWMLGDDTLAQARLEESVALWREVGDQRGLALALQALPVVAQPDAARANLVTEESLALFRALGDAWGIALTQHAAGLGALRTGEHERAQPWLSDALAGYRALGDDWFCAQVLNNLGDVARSRGGLIDAAAWYEESLALFRSLGASAYLPGVLHNLAYVALRRGEIDRAQRLFRESLERFCDHDDQRGVAECLAGLAGVLGALQQPVRAIRLFAAVESLLATGGVALWPPNRIEVEQDLAAARAHLDAVGFAAAWAEGQALTSEQAMTAALAD